MESTIRKIFSGLSDEQVHSEFVKYSKGVFTNKYLVDGKKQKQGWSIKTSAEFANYLVRSCLEKTSGDIAVTGAIIATFDVKSKAKFEVERIKQFMGIKQAVINTQTSPKNIIELMNELPRAFYALSFSTPQFQLKIKAKAPKGAKPAATGEKAASPDFCSIKTSDSDIIKDLFFDIPEFKEVSISHRININEIILPKGVSDPVELREKAKRRGLITRIAIIDGKEKKSEMKFEA